MMIHFWTCFAFLKKRNNSARRSTPEVANATGFYSLATNFSHLVAKPAAKIFFVCYYYLFIFYSSNECNECPIVDYT